MNIVSLLNLGLLAISRATSLEYYHNDKVSIDFHLYHPLGELVTRYTTFDIFEPYHNFVPKHAGYKIGNVFADGRMLYEDCRALKHRVVSCRLRDASPDVVNLYSIYDRGGQEYREVVEFRREGAAFAEVVRRPVELDLSNDINVSEAVLSYKLVHLKVRQFRIRCLKRFSFVIGVVRYGPAIIDADIHGVTWKEVTRVLEEDGVQVKVRKRTRGGYDVLTLYRLAGREGGVEVTLVSEEVRKLF